MDYRVACKAAIGKGIIVNTIHCGSYETGVSTKWKDGAVLADGKYMHIDQNQKVVHIDAPQDAELLRLNAEINTTYIAYGSMGKAGAANQQAQDTNAVNYSNSVAAGRVTTKSTSNYRNESWDLVDAINSLKELKDDELPEDMRKMTLEQREAYIKEKTAERTKIQQEIKKLSALRNKYIAAERKKLTGKDKKANTLEAVIIRAIREQLTKKKFKFETINASPEKSSEPSETGNSGKKAGKAPD